jgi:quinol monooxygenase YgiN
MTMTKAARPIPGYTYIWDYEVAEPHVGDFERTYGSDGDWVQLFRLARGYIRTELHRDCRRPDRFLTIDYWESRAAWETFRADFAEQFEELDARCGGLTVRETEIGRFEPA